MLKPTVVLLPSKGRANTVGLQVYFPWFTWNGIPVDYLFISYSYGDSPENMRLIAQCQPPLFEYFRRTCNIFSSTVNSSSR